MHNEIQTYPLQFFLYICRIFSNMIRYRKIPEVIMDKQIFFAKNPWRTGIIPQPPGIKRTLLEPLISSLADPCISIVLGARATGKTTLLLHVITETLTRGLALPEDIFYFDLDTMDCKDILQSNRTLMDFIGITPDSGYRKKFVVIDEVQRLFSPGIFLKSVHDLHLSLKVLVTGSSS